MGIHGGTMLRQMGCVAIFFVIFLNIQLYAAQSPLVYSASDTPTPLVADDTTTSEISTGDPSGTAPLYIGDVNVQLDITCSSTSALIVSPSSPEGTEITLFNELDGDGQNFTNVELNDQADSRIGLSYAPYTGVWQPEGNLADFEGENARGVWTLTVYDAGGGYDRQYQQLEPRISQTNTRGHVPGQHTLRRWF